jgi:acyl carrier protein
MTERTLQDRIAAHWRDLLEVDRVQPGDHFIELGGNSMLATMLANRIEQELGVRPTVTDLFDTLHNVAATCEQLLAEHAP